jgi:hypothetical protein
LSADGGTAGQLLATNVSRWHRVASPARINQMLERKVHAVRA